jgi:hypothetical protein
MDKNGLRELSYYDIPDINESGSERIRYENQKLERVVWFLLELVRCFQQKTIGNMKRSVHFGMNYPKNMAEKTLEA